MRRRYGSSVGSAQAQTALPGEDVVHLGLRDLDEGIESVESLMV